MTARPPASWSQALALLLGALAASACADKATEAAEDARRVVATSSADATVSIQNDELGFALDRPGEGWKLLQPADAAALVPGALAGALSADGITGVLRLEKRGGTLAELAKRRMSELELVRLAGHKAHRLLATGMRAGVALRFALTLVEQGERVWALWAWGAAAAVDEASLVPFFRAFHPRDGANATPPAADPAPMLAAAGAVTASQSLRGKVFHDYERGVVLTMPDDSWRAEAGASARAVDEAASLHLVHRDPPIDVLLILEDAGELDGPRYHEQARQRLDTAGSSRLGPPVEAKVGELAAHLSKGSGGDVAQRLWTAVDESLALQLIARGSDRALGGKELAALLRALELRRGVRAVEMTTEVYRDNRLGFELRQPARLHRADITPANLAARGSLVRWEGNGRWLAVAAAHIGRAGEGSAWMGAFLEQLLRQELGPSARGPAERTAIELAGQPAVRLSWAAPLEHVDALMIVRGELVYALLTLDHSGDLFQKATLGFKLLP